jgi:lysyl-tRNA synthetase class 2
VTVTSRRDRHARALVAVYAVATLLAAFLWLTRRWGAHHATWVETAFGAANVPLSHSLVSVCTLGLVTAALVCRKRAALVAVVVLQLLAGYAAAAALGLDGLHDVLPWWDIDTGNRAVLDVVSMAVAGLTLLWAWWLRPAFPARLRPGSWLTAVVAAVSGLAVTIATTWLLLSLAVPADEQVRARLVGAAVGRSLGDPDLITAGAVGPVAAWVPEVTSVLLSATLLVTAWLFTRSARSTTAWTPDHEVAIRRLVAGSDDPGSLDYFATRRDKSVVFSRSGGAALTYRVLHGVSLASGDPVGDPREWPDAIAAWKDEARRFGWVPAVLACSERGARAFAAAGLHPIRIGDEAILDPDRFVLDSAGMTPVRHAVRRARRAGLVVTFRRQADVEAAELAELATAAEAWRGGEPERGFSMALNRHGDPADADVLVVTVRDPAERLVALLTLVPWGRSGRSLDLMRRHPDAPNGTIELAVAELLRAAPRLGVRRVSLNFCVFRAVYADAARLGAGPLTRLNYSVLGRLDRLWQLERLYRSNQKFDPEWRPRFVCHDGRLTVPLVAVAAAVAEGFLPRPFARDPHPEGLDAQHLAEVRRLAALPAAPPTHRDEQERARLRHAGALRASGRAPWPAHDETTAGCVVRESGAGATVTARVARIRDHGGVVFVDLVDHGTRRQAILECRTPSADARTFARYVDVGDLVRLTGVAGHSKSGEPSLLVDAWDLRAKALHPLALDRPRRTAHRVRDLLARPGSADLLRARAAVVRALRTTLEEAGYLEVETPVLNAVHGGATARPFRTRGHAYGVDLTLRIAPELQLKRLVVAGMGPLFEIGRNFRNEGADATHNPEFTSLEAYLPDGDFVAMRQLTERLVRTAARAVHGREVLLLRTPDGTEEVDVSGPWRCVPMLDALGEVLDGPVSMDTDVDRLLALARAHDVPVRDDAGPGAVLEGLYGALVEPRTVQPTFYTHFPRETSPLTRPSREDPRLVERWDLVVGGTELATAYSELTDPLDQRERLVEQSLRAAAGDVEAMELDEDFLRDLECGMPPTGGLGIGVDRLVMAVVGAPIREVLAFPFTRPAPVRRPPG